VQKPVPQELNSLNLLEISKALYKIEHFIFFGTLLGIVRDGDIIPYDDDIDFYVDINLRTDLIIALKEYGFDVNENKWPNFSKYFLQLQIKRDGIQTYVDFYFYDQSNKNYIIEKWNFSGNIDNVYNEMHIPKDLIFPLQTFKYRDVEILIPNKPVETCIFLYGKNWNVPLKKNIQYSNAMFFHRPIVLKGIHGKFIMSTIKYFQSFKQKLRRLPRKAKSFFKMNY
jgi:hypothetical protein